MRVPNPHLHDCHEHMAFRLSHGDESILRTLNAGGSLKAWRAERHEAHGDTTGDGCDAR